MRGNVPLATSRYHAAALIHASGFVPVGISVGTPKRKLDYEPVMLRELAPYGLLQIENDDDFTRRYVARLERFGVELIRERLEAISAGHDSRGLALLCFEKAGAFCHRSLFAGWWESATGEPVPELGQAQVNPKVAHLSGDLRTGIQLTLGIPRFCAPLR